VHDGWGTAGKGMGSEKRREAKPDEHWILDAYGSNQFERVRKLGEELAEPYGVDISLRLANDACFPLREQGPGIHWPPSKRLFHSERDK
jgi:hypothetical protein